MKWNKIGSNLIKDWEAKLISFLVAIGIFMVIHYASIAQRIVTLPVECTLPSGYQAVSLVPKEVEVEMHGPDNIIYLVNPDTIQALVDFSFVKEEGIASAPVRLVYDAATFSDGAITLNSDPLEFRVKFEKDKP